MDFDEPPWSDITAAIQEHAIPVLLIVLAAIVAMRLATLFVHGIIKALLDREASEGTAQELSAVEMKKRMDTLDAFVAHTLRAFIVIIAGLMILAQTGVNIGPAIAGLGVIGIAIGFGAQTLVRDYLNGALILLENQFAKGDEVRVAGVSGTVEDFTLRRTTLRDLDGVVHTIPNGDIRVASNTTRVWARINQDITLPYGTDIERATAIVDDVGRAMLDDPVWKRRVLEPPRVEGVEALGEGGITLKILGSVRATEQRSAAGEYRKRLLRALETHGLQIPSAHRLPADGPGPSSVAGGGRGPAPAPARSARPQGPDGR